MASTAHLLPLDGGLRAAGVRRAGEVAAQPRGTVASGFLPLDAVLPGGGWPRGALVEMQLANPGVGELQLLGGALTQTDRAGRVAFLDPPAEPGVAALQALGLAARSITVTRSMAPRDWRWAAEQLARSGAFAAVLFWSPAPLDDRLARRLSLAIAAGGGLGFVFGPPSTRTNSVPLRLGLRSDGATLRVDVLKRRGPPAPPVRVERSHALASLPFPIART